MNSLRRIHLLVVAIMIMSLSAVVVALPSYAETTTQLVIILKNGKTYGWPISDVSRIEVKEAGSPIGSSSNVSPDVSGQSQEICATGCYYRIYQNTNTRGNSRGYEWHFQNIGFYESSDGSGVNLGTVNNITASRSRGGQGITDMLATSGSYYIFGSYESGQTITIKSPNALRSVTYRNPEGSSWAPASVKILMSTNGIKWKELKTYTDDGSKNQQLIVF